MDNPAVGRSNFYQMGWKKALPSQQCYDTGKMLAPLFPFGLFHGVGKASLTGFLPRLERFSCRVFTLTTIILKSPAMLRRKSSGRHIKRCAKNSILIEIQTTRTRKGLSC